MPSTPLHGKVRTGSTLVGTVRFVGCTSFSSDPNFTWVGVELDKPMGALPPKSADCNNWLFSLVFSRLDFKFFTS